MDTTACRRPRKGTLHTLLLAGALLLLGALPVGMHLGQQLAIRRLAQTLSASVGLPVSIDGIWGTLRPSVVISGLRIGGDRPLLRLERIELLLDLWNTPRGSVKEVRLVRPVLEITDDRWRRWLDAPPAEPELVKTPARPSKLARRTDGVRVTIEDGSVHVRLRAWRGHQLDLRSIGISLAPRGAAARLVLGHTTIQVDGHPLLDLAATGADLDRRRGHRPLRAALLGGGLRPPGDRTGDGFTLHSVSLSPTRDGYRLQGIAKPAGQDTGKIIWRAHLGEDFRPLGRDGVELTLRNVDLTQVGGALESFGLRPKGTRLTGGISLSREGEGYFLSARLTGEGVQLQHPLIARLPVGPFRAELEAAAGIDAERGRIRLDRLRVQTGDLELVLRGRIGASPSGGVQLALDLGVPTAPCQKLLASLPPGLTPALRGLGLEGDLGLMGSLRLDSADLEGTQVDLDFTPLGCRVLADPPAADVRTLKGPITIKVAGARNVGQPWTLGPANPDFTPLWKISGHARSAFVVAEDSAFFAHRGFDGRQLVRAFVNNLKEGRAARGASTISQQLVKNVFLGGERTLARKLQEAVLTWRLEQVIPKSRILELYLNLVEMGPGVYGVSQAAQLYFKHKPSQLTALEAAKLAALTPSPRHLAQRLLEGNPGDAMRERIQLLLRLMKRRSAAVAPAQPVPAGQQISALDQN